MPEAEVSIVIPVHNEACRLQETVFAVRDTADTHCMHRLVALDGSTGTLHRSKAEAGRNPLLYETMVLFDDVV